MPNPILAWAYFRGSPYVPPEPTTYHYRIEPCCEKESHHVWYVLVEYVGGKWSPALVSVWHSEIEAQAEADWLEELKATPTQAS